MASTIRKIASADRKAWTRETYRGTENLLYPSFGPDLVTLDEDDLRRDVPPRRPK